MSERFAKAIDDLFDDKITIRTERLALDKIREDDQRDIWEIFGDDDVTRYTDFSTRKDYADSKKVVDYFLDCYDDREQYRFAIRLKDSGELIGTIGLFSFDDDSDLAEVGYELKKRYWKRGYMSESLKGLASTFFGRMGGHRLEAIITPGNADSERTLRRCGFQKEGAFRKRDYFKGQFWDGEIYGLLADEYLPGE